VGAGSADCDLVEVLLGLLLCHGQTSIVRQDGDKCESWAVLAVVQDGCGWRDWRALREH
jgi:hypothetical protein